VKQIEDGFNVCVLTKAIPTALRDSSTNCRWFLGVVAGTAGLAGCLGDNFEERDLVWNQQFSGEFSAVIDHISDGRVIVP